MALNDNDQYLEAIAKAQTAAFSYYDGDAELMTDAEYDQLLEDIRAFEATLAPAAVIEHGLFTEVAAGVSAGGDIVHERPMQSLAKSTEASEVRSFLDKVEALGGTVTVEPKLDGLAINLVYIDGELTTVATRGDGTTGEDVTDKFNALIINGAPKVIYATGHVNIRGELLMSDFDFEFSNMNRVAAGKPAFANPRNAAAGTLRRETVNYASQMSFIAYGAVIDDANFTTHAEVMAHITRLGFTTAASLFTAGTTVMESVEDFGLLRAGFPYPTDGAVLTVEEFDIREQLGSTSRAPRWALAFKYAAQKATTKLLAIEEAVGRTGNISYTAILEPVLVDGSTVGRATLHNPAFIADNDLRINDVVEIFKANDIIPRVVQSFPEFRTADSAPYEPSRFCPISGEPLIIDGAIWRSPAPEASIGALIAYAASRDALDIDGMSTAIADALVSGDEPLVNDLGDLFTLTRDQLANLNLGQTATGGTRTVGYKTADKIIANIEKAKNQPLNRTITALGIRKSGRTFGRRIANTFHTMDNILAASKADFLKVEGVGDGRQDLFFDGFQALRPVIAKLAAAGVNMGEEPAATADGGALPLEGMKVVVTGAVTGPLAGLSRNEVNELIEQMGGKSSGSVSKTTSLLVSSEPGSSKSVKAAELGVKTVTPEEFATMIGR